MDRPLHLLAANARDLARAVIAQLMFLAVAAVAFALVLRLTRLLRGLVRRALRRYDPSCAEMVAWLVHVGAVVLGLDVALWIAIPSLQFAVGPSFVVIPRRSSAARGRDWPPPG